MVNIIALSVILPSPTSAASRLMLPATRNANTFAARRTAMLSTKTRATWSCTATTRVISPRKITTDPKVTQLANDAPAIPQLGIPAYQWWSEALHGVSDDGRGVFFNGSIHATTNFPQVLLTSASFDSHLWFRIGQAIGKEARAMYNSGQATGVTLWAPNINIFRDPRWGRGQETPGEDPLVTGKYTVSYVRGLQGDSFEGGSKLIRDGNLQASACCKHVMAYDLEQWHNISHFLHQHPVDSKLIRDGNLQASACCKHFMAYDLEQWHNISHFLHQHPVSAQDLADTYQPPFRSCIQEGRATGIMCVYNQVNGVPNCAEYNLLTNAVRKEWGFNGYITSDCDVVQVLLNYQNYTEFPEDAAAIVLKAGLDMDCGTAVEDFSFFDVEQKKLQEAEIDRALIDLFAIRMRLGLFNGDSSNYAILVHHKCVA